MFRSIQQMLSAGEQQTLLDCLAVASLDEHLCQGLSSQDLPSVKEKTKNLSALVRQGFAAKAYRDGSGRRFLYMITKEGQLMASRGAFVQQDERDAFSLTMRIPEGCKIVWTIDGPKVHDDLGEFAYPYNAFVYSAWKVWCSATSFCNGTAIPIAHSGELNGPL
jgi:hypothetical protein